VETRARISAAKANKRPLKCFEATVSKETKDQIVIEYLSGLPLNDLAKKYHACRRAIRRILLDLGVSIRPRRPFCPHSPTT
jgi:hypothetical protein